MKTILKLFTMLFCVASFSQTTIKGKIMDNTGLPLPGANIVVIGTSTGTISDFDGNYTITLDQAPPFSIRVSYTGFESKTIAITSTDQTVDVTLAEGSVLDEVVISASRTPERIFESPVTVERFGLKEIKNTASADFYDGLENLKGVDINTNSLTFKSINTRGFATFANTRFMQLVDGMDNSAPTLNFPLGNLLGMTETDILSVELLPGASSALYGANAFNGILFMRSKSPFDNAGISAYFKGGITSQEAAGDNEYKDYGIRMAYKFSEKFAAKVNFAYLQGTDWAANDTSGINGRGFIDGSSTRENDPNYNGVNIYGDIASTSLGAVAASPTFLAQLPNPALADLLPQNQSVSRTGYAEGDLTDYDAKSIKADWGLYFRPWENDFEIQYVGKIGSGSTIYQGSNRYSINNFFLQQHKIEIKNDNFFVRGYVTADNAGDSYDMTFTGLNMNRQWKDDNQWFGEYAGQFIQSTLGGANANEAHTAARAAADTGRLVPGTPEFQDALERVTSDPDVLTGSRLRSESQIWHADANYNLSHLTSDFADIQVGGSFRQYVLNSFGSVYTDKDGSIDYSELGVYTQIQKNFLEDDRLKVTASMRYDKSELFDAFFSPRVSIGYNIGKEQNHNVRASFQTGFRNPDTQALYIGLNAGRVIILGSASDNPERENRAFDVSPQGQAFVGGASSINFSGSNAYNNSFTASSVRAFGASRNPGDLEIANPSLVVPEQVSSYEVGYRGKVEGFVIDASAYMNQYQDFISTVDVVSTFYGDAALTQTIPGTPIPIAVAAIANNDFQAYRAYTNTDADVNSFGAAIGVSTKVLGGFDLSANYTYAKLDFDREANPDFQTNFNTPEHKVKASFGKTEVLKNLGFNLAWRWSDTYIWESSFVDGIVPSFHVFDAQINYTVESLKSTFKLGAANLLNDEYFTAAGTGFIGAQYYISWTINNL